MQHVVPFACFLSMIRPPGVLFEQGLLQIAPVNKAKCPYVKEGVDIEFQLFTRHNPTVYQKLAAYDDEKLFASNIDFHAPTVIYFGAFLEQPDEGSGLMVREAYMLRGDTNVIMVDARTLEAGPWYFTAAENTWYIGQFAASFVDYLVTRGLNLNNTHLIGHSLGAQSAGVTGAALKSGRVSRITGLDPAFPLFDKLPLEQRLDPSDAEFVDVIHTDAGIFGFNRPMGHADFYPNGGISPQPGCELEVVLHQPIITNKCEGQTQQPGGLYIFYLQPNDKKDFKTRLYEFFTHINTLKNTDKEKDKNVDTDNKSVDCETKNANRKEVKDKKLHSSKTKADKGSIILAKLSRSDSTDIDRTINIYTDNTQDVKDKYDTQNTSENSDKIKKEKTPTVLSVCKAKKNSNTKTTQSKLHIIQNKDVTDHKTINDKQNNDHTIIKSTELNADKILKISTEKTKHDIIQRNKRQKRFIPFLQKSEAAENDNLLMRMLEFLFKYRKNVLPVISVMREINTLVKSGNGELNHILKERNNYFGTSPVLPSIGTYTLELGGESKVTAFAKRLLGLSPKGDRLTIANGK